MASLRTTIPFSFWVLSLLLLFTSMEAKEFVVGGDKCSWAALVSSLGSIQEWADTNRFIVGDILIFEYDPESDTVLQATKENYQRCNGTTPIKKYDDGRTKIELDLSGHFYFIGDHGNDSCVSGQRLTVAVISDELRHGQHTPNKPNHNHTAVAPTPSPTQPPSNLPDIGGATLGLRSGFMGIFFVGVGTLGGAQGPDGHLALKDSR